jgi:hypothetical protein
MPTKKVLIKLIKRATQIEDPTSEINHKELKLDPSKVKKDVEEDVDHSLKFHKEIKLQEVHGLVVYGGVD